MFTVRWAIYFENQNSPSFNLCCLSAPLVFRATVNRPFSFLPPSSRRNLFPSVRVINCLESVNRFLQFWQLTYQRREEDRERLDGREKSSIEIETRDPTISKWKSNLMVTQAKKEGGPLNSVCWPNFVIWEKEKESINARQTQGMKWRTCDEIHLSFSRCLRMVLQIERHSFPLTVSPFSFSSSSVFSLESQSRDVKRASD